MVAPSKRLSQVTHNDDGTKEAAYYSYNPHTDVEVLTNQSGDAIATYGYTAYGRNDDPQFTGVDKPDDADPTREPYNPYRFNSKRWDQHSQSYDMGFRDYNPGLNRFLTRDMYNGALADLRLGLEPFTGNRYAFGGGNPISAIEIDGHDFDWGEFFSAWGEGTANYLPDKWEGIQQVFSDPGGTLVAISLEAIRWDIKIGGGPSWPPSQVGMGCALTGLCQFVDDCISGNSYECGYQAGQLSYDVIGGVAIAGATGGTGGIAGVIARVTSALGHGQLPRIRVPGDVRREQLYPTPPDARTTGTVGRSPTQNALIQQWVQDLRAMGADDIRVDQEQVNADGVRVGRNRPDLQYTIDGQRYYYELEGPGSDRGPGHVYRILANDPRGIALWVRVPW